jgi:hypothetical protein
MHDASEVAAIAAFGVVSHRLFRFKRWSDEIKHLPMFLAMFAFCIIELVVENFFVWCASLACCYAAC